MSVQQTEMPIYTDSVWDKNAWMEFPEAWKVAESSLTQSAGHPQWRKAS
jgi:hypothetical protein